MESARGVEGEYSYDFVVDQMVASMKSCPQKHSTTDKLRCTHKPKECRYAYWLRFERKMNAKFLYV